MPRRTKDEIRARRAGLEKAVGRLQSWRPAGEVLTRVRAMPTIFPDLDRRTRVGGWPIERFGLIHGPSNHGKTAFGLGLGRSFLRAGSFFGFMDAEHAAPIDWVERLLGREASSPGFVAKRPRNYESAVDSVREFVEMVGAVRESGDVPPDTTGLVLVDSIRKLVPDRLIEKIAKSGADSKKGSVDGLGGRAAMYKAALNAQWLDELIPLLYHTRTALVFVAREAENPDAGPFEKEWKVGGGRAPFYEASLVCRISRSGWVKSGSSDAARTVGERIRIDIHKTKVGGKDDKLVTAYFHLSNGVLVPEGFDRARDIAEVALDLGLLGKGSNGRIESPDTGEVWRSIHAFAEAMEKEPATLDGLERLVRKRIDEETA